ncbi:MAG TPA: efflux transporter outer membrane subunit, partial [Telmatospirillum sp.]|nr:efflux transporter outer membrane subunit [Telmatospirillum sp.]
LGPSLGYTVDLFGLTRRTVEQQEALAENQQYLLAEAYLSLTGDAVTEAIAIAAARLQIATASDVIASDQKTLDLVRRKFEMGKAARTDILTAESQLLGDRAQLSSLRQQLSVARHALAVLASRSPAEWMPPEFDIGDFSLPHELPASVPSALVRQRPDILAAEAQLHAAGAAIGVATAQLYPTLTLSGALTQQSSGIETVLKGASALWSLGANVAVPVFHGGALEAQKQAAIDAYAAQLATFQQTVIQAFGQVADVLRALDHDAEFIANVRQSLDVSEKSLALQRASYDAGKTSLLDLIVAERAYAQARSSFASAQIQQFQDVAQFFVVMGGGWWEAGDVFNAQGALD